MTAITSVAPPLHAASVHKLPFISPTIWKTDLLARAILISALMFFCGPGVGFINAVLIFGIEMGARAIGRLFMKSYSHWIAHSKNKAIHAVAKPIETIPATESLLRFLKTSPNFAANPNFEKFIYTYVQLPPGSVTVDGNILTISMKEPSRLHYDPEMPLGKDEFLKMNRHTETENLIQLPDKSVNPMPAHLPLFKMGSLNYFRSFGEIVATIIQTKKNFPLGPNVVLKLEGDTLEFVEGGIMNICSMEFQPGWPEEEGLLAISTRMLFWTVTRLYFLSDVGWLLGKLK